MLINGFKKAAGNAQDLVDLKDAYDSTYADGGFQWLQGLDYARSLGYNAVLDLPGERTSSKTPQIVNVPTQAFLNSELAAGDEVLVSTTFGAGKWGALGGGHVILITGRAPTYTQMFGYLNASGPAGPEQDYVVDDPAGNYFASVTHHYGSASCGSDVIYPWDFIGVNIMNRPALAIPRTAGADPAVVYASDATASDSTSFWLQDQTGAKTGWTGGSGSVSNIPSSLATMAPVLTSDPSAPYQAFKPNTGPHVAMAFDPAQGVKLHVALPKGGGYRLNVTVFLPGGSTRNIVVSGTLPRGGSRIVTLPLPKPTSLSVKVAKTTVTPGTADVISGVLLSGKAGLAKATVQLWSALPGHPFTRLASGLTTSGGRIAFTVRPTATRKYELAFAGSPSFDTSHSNALSITVQLSTLLITK